MVERSAPSNFTSVSYALWASRTPVNSYATAGSSEIRSLVSAYQTSVLAAPPVACGVGLPALGGGWLHAARRFLFLALRGLRRVGSQQPIFQRSAVEAADDRLHLIAGRRLDKSEALGFLRFVVSDHFNGIGHEIFGG